MIQDANGSDLDRIAELFRVKREPHESDLDFRGLLVAYLEGRRRRR